MDFVEASNIDLQKEASHWWIKTRFQYIDLALEKFKGKEISVLEIGCGTAQNLAFLRNESRYKNQVTKVVGVDLNLPKNFSRPDLQSCDKLLNSLEDLEGSEKYNLIIMLDLIEHLDDPVKLLKEYKKYLVDDGVLLILVPSFQSLWSQHDIALGHVKRYTLAILNNETQSAGFRRIREGYLFSVFFPIVFILRKFFRDNSGNHAESDLKLPNPVINFLCYFLGIVERKFGNILPFGTSAFGIYEQDQ
jgi:SAM-dependent methyltransferase